MEKRVRACERIKYDEESYKKKKHIKIYDEVEIVIGMKDDV